jgi:hypothetical protein
MTRPTEKQLAEALLKAKTCNLSTEVRDVVNQALSAYRSAQQAEALAPITKAFERGFARGRQQGMEQARAKSTRHLPPLPRGLEMQEPSITAAIRAYAADAFEYGRTRGMEQERALWELAKDALESGMYDDALCQPAASSAQQCGDCNCLTQCGDVEAWAAESTTASAAQPALGWIGDWVPESLAKRNGAPLEGVMLWPSDVKDKTWLVPVFLQPQAERKPLGETQIASIALDHWTVDPVSFTRAIETAHGIGAPSTASDEGSV